MWQLDYKESWAPKNWCFWTVVLEKTLESPLNCKEIQSVHPKGDQSWVFIGKIDVEAETSLLWPPNSRADSFEKTLMLGKIEGRRRRGQQDEMHHRLDGHGFGWTPGVGDRQGGLACCSSWGCKESDMTGRLNWTELIYITTSLFIHLLFLFLIPVLSPFSKSSSGEGRRRTKLGSKQKPFSFLCFVSKFALLHWLLKICTKYFMFQFFMLKWLSLYIKFFQGTCV